MRKIPLLLSLILPILTCAQAMYFSSASVMNDTSENKDGGLSAIIASDSQKIMPDSIPAPVYESLADSLLAEAIVTDTVMSMAPLPSIVFMPAVYSTYILPEAATDNDEAFAPELTGNSALRWLEETIATNRRAKAIMQRMFISNPGSVIYTLDELPEPPKEYVVEINPEDHTVSINEFIPVIENTTLEAIAVKKRHWIRTFNASLQFSQAYVSPNWYQGGNNNLNSLLNLYYNVKLNPEYHPNLLFESTFQYKLGINNAPDDTLRGYSVSEDILQINSVLGIKAAKKWYYSLTAQFKTQVVNSYNINSDKLRSALFSPGELTVGLGMTYNTANAKKTFTFDASIAPLSYNLNICTNEHINPTLFGVDEGKKTKSSFGSSMECKLMWKLTYNITYTSRLFGFTDYDRAYADWENTLAFEINRYLTTQIYAHLRYDTHTPPVEDPNWRKLQVKEIFSLGLQYKFSTI